MALFLFDAPALRTVLIARELIASRPAAVRAWSHCYAKNCEKKTTAAGGFRPHAG